MGVAGDLEGRVLAAIGEAVVVVDLEGRVSGWEGASEAVFGCRAADAVGRPLRELLRAPPDVGEALALGGAERAELVVPIGEEGGERAAAVSVRRLFDAGGRVAGAIAQVKPLGPWIDPAESGAGFRRHWHRTLGGAVRGLVELAGHDLGAMDDHAGLPRLLVGQARRLLPDLECLVCVVPAQRQDQFQVVAGSGPWAEGLVGSEFAWEGSVAGRAMRERHTIETAMIQSPSVVGTVMREGGIQSGRLVPLLPDRPLPDGRGALGLLGFYRATRAYFTPYERRLMEEFSQLVSLALQRAELRRSAAETAARLRTAVDVSLDLGLSLEPAHVIRSLLRRAAEALGASRAALAAVDGDPVQVRDSWDREGADMPALHSLTLPLVLEGSTTALLTVSRSRDEPFSRQDAMTLQLVGNVAALAIGNARLFAQAQGASAARGDFLNMTAHELRTPLTVVSGYLSMFYDGTFGEAPPRWKGPIRLLVVKTQELAEAVDDLLLASRLESGGLEPQVVRMDVRRAIQATARRAARRVEMLEGELVLDLPDEPVEVRADPEDVERVLDNLVNNALTYRRPDARAWVRMFATVEDGFAVVGVEDHGRGVRPEIRDRIFDRFVRGQDTEGGNPPGTGLGLYICRQLASRHQGRVQLDATEPGRGSCFTLRLPVAPG
jgi:signal transduction histidine kinase